MLKTTPRGATVTLGGMEAGKSPVTFKGILAGNYPLRVSLDGYVPIEREVEVKAGQFVDLGTIALQRSNGTIDGTRQVIEAPKAIEPPKVTTEHKEESQPQPPASASQLAVPVNDFGGG